MIVHVIQKKCLTKMLEINFGGDSVLVVSPDKFQRDYNRP